MLSGKKIILGVTASIAAYKAAVLTRLLVKAGAEVRVVMTPAAHDFITPLTLSTLSRNPVLTPFIRDEAGTWNNHVDLALWADAIVIAPASANTIAKMAHGGCDNLLLAVYLSARTTVFVSPAMDLDMLAHPSTRANIERLEQFGNIIIKPGFGDLASGLTGAGRMAEPEEIISILEHHLNPTRELEGKTAMVTAGPTYEEIDPVRFIGNRSSGKMGFAIAEALASRGAKVQLVTGPTALHTNNAAITVTSVTSAEEMYQKCQAFFPGSDIAVFSAAVADYTPATKATQKIKKKTDNLVIELVKTPDIAASLGSLKKKGQVTVGFALETENEEQNAKGKLEKKNFDLIVLNSLNDTGAGFGHDTNKVVILDAAGSKKQFELKTKTGVAHDIVEAIIKKIQA